jgi:hypothetical protein
MHVLTPINKYSPISQRRSIRRSLSSPFIQLGKPIQIILLEFSLSSPKISRPVSINASNAKEPIEKVPNPEDFTDPKVNGVIQDEVELIRSGI